MLNLDKIKKFVANPTANLISADEINIDEARAQFTAGIRDRYKDKKQEYARTVTTLRWENRAIANISDIVLACKEVYDAGVIFNHAQDGRDKRKDMPQKDAVLQNLAQRIYNYFNQEEQVDFEQWFSESCNIFSSEINEKRNRVGYVNISFGQVQKMINMVMKYLNCYSDNKNYYQRFVPCHAPLDSIMKDDVWRVISKSNYSNKKLYKEKVKTCAWTALEDVQVYNEYQNAVRYIATCLSAVKSTIPLEIDVYLWTPQNKD